MAEAEHIEQMAEDSEPGSLDQTTRTFHAKRPHRKTRTGCKNCKKRRVKCNEARPVCQSCAIRKIPCEYAAPIPPKEQRQTQTPEHHHNDLQLRPYSHSQQATAYVTLQGLSSPSSSGNISEVSRSPSPSLHPLIITELQFCPAPVDLMDMQLLWFYTTSTCASFNPGIANPTTDDIMQGALVRHAFKARFLLDSIFALAALHLQTVQQSIGRDRELMYRARAYEGYRKAVAEASEPTYPALVATSLLLTAISSQHFRDPTSKDLYIIDWMVVWRGIGVMIGLATVPVITESGLGALFNRPVIELDAATGHVPTTLHYMVQSMTLDDEDFASIEVYHRALLYLGSLFKALKIALDPVMRLRVVTWFTFIPDEFAELVRQKRPRALIIIAYYAAFIKLNNRLWWLNGIGDRTINDITKHVGIEWMQYLLMPMRVMGQTNIPSIQNLILAEEMYVHEQTSNSEETI